MPFHPIPCKQCRRVFIPKTYRNVFHTRSCFIKFYRKQSKVSKYPVYICKYCGHQNNLTFHPLISTEKWNKFRCSKCRHKVGT